MSLWGSAVPSSPGYVGTYEWLGVALGTRGAAQLRQRQAAVQRS
jgi:hypothetical protein